MVATRSRRRGSVLPLRAGSLRRLPGKSVDWKRQIAGESLENDVFARSPTTLTTIGMFLGLICSLAISKVIANLLYGVSATDLLTFVVISLLLAAVALIACFFPARRATRVDPVAAIKSL